MHSSDRICQEYLPSNLRPIHRAKTLLRLTLFLHIFVVFQECPQSAIFWSTCWQNNLQLDSEAFHSQGYFHLYPSRWPVRNIRVYGNVQMQTSSSSPIQCIHGVEFPSSLIQSHQQFGLVSSFHLSDWNLFPRFSSPTRKVVSTRVVLPCFFLLEYWHVMFQWLTQTSQETLL